MFKIIRNGKNFNTKKFPTYLDAKRYVCVWAVNNKLARVQREVRLNSLGFSIKPA